jgi:hypothetical protein
MQSKSVQLYGPAAAPHSTWYYSALSLVPLVSMGASVYHGMKRHNGSIGWGVWWGFLGTLFPVVTPTVALAQGFGKCKYDCSTVRGPRRRSRKA